MRNHDIAARKCTKCHRVFSKVEHLRRHQRSHTGERPFKCTTCGRAYARSDVLNRHIRHHHPASVEVDGPAGDDMLERTSPPPHADCDEADTGSRRPSSSPRNTAPECPTPQDFDIHDSVHGDWNGTHPDVLPTLYPSCTEGLREFLEDIRDLEGTDDQRPPRSTALSSPRRAFNPFDALIDPSLGLPQPSVPRSPSGIVPPGVDFGSVLLDGLLLTPPAAGDQRLRQHQKDGISNEQFEQVRRLWPTRRRTVTLSPSPVCWDDIVLHPEDNIFSSTSLKALANLEPAALTGSPWGLTETCRHRLVQSMRGYASHSANRTDDPDIGSPSSSGPWNGEPPPTDILDLCLDLYFGQFHVHLPFVHPGTFKACETPSILLFPMCLVGMMILNRSAARKLIADHLPGAIHHCRAELTSQSLRHCPGPDLLTVLGSACLILFIAASTAEIAFEEQRQALYVEALSLARDRGLFAPRSFDRTLIQAVGDDDIIWKAWARIQSAQRLTACLILADAYSAQMLGVSPILSPGQIHIPLIYRDALFAVHSSHKWKSLIGVDDQWSQPLSVVLDIQNFPSGLSGFGLQTALAVIWLRVLKPHHQLQGPMDVVPESWTPYPTSVEHPETSSSAPSLGSCLGLAFDVYGAELGDGNANSLILWHYLCLRLATDLAVIEDAAGRNGPEAANVAVQSLKLWARSPGARRACLHAAQMFVIINHHRRSDGVMLHSEMALFNAALVMGFYLFTAPDFKSSDGPCYDLFEEVNWTQVGTLGLDAQPPQQDAVSPVSAASVFIQDGGPVCFHGAEYCSPYGAARRSFMNVASQLEEVGRWNVQEYCRVLRIISDTLFTSDNQNAGSRSLL